MNTSKPFASISYNTKEFLIEKLNDLVNRRYISFYTFVYHYAEEDEKKPHIHLYIMPNGMVDTNQIHDELLEIDVNNLDLPPLAIMPCVSSKFADWYLYSSHNVDYLISKGLERQYHYNFDDFVSSNEDYMLELVHTIDYTKYTKSKEFVEGIKDGKRLIDFIQNGSIPVNQFLQFKSMYEYFCEKTFREEKCSIHE